MWVDGMGFRSEMPCLGNDRQLQAELRHSKVARERPQLPRAVIRPAAPRENSQPKGICDGRVADTYIQRLCRATRFSRTS